MKKTTVQKKLSSRTYTRARLKKIDANVRVLCWRVRERERERERERASKALLIDSLLVARARGFLPRAGLDRSARERAIQIDSAVNLSHAAKVNERIERTFLRWRRPPRTKESRAIDLIRVFVYVRGRVSIYMYGQRGKRVERAVVRRRVKRRPRAAFANSLNRIWHTK